MRLTTWTYRIIMAALLVLLFFVADASDRRVHKANDAVIEPCALVLTKESGPECR